MICKRIVFMYFFLNETKPITKVSDISIKHK